MVKLGFIASAPEPRDAGGRDKGLNSDGTSSRVLKSEKKTFCMKSACYRPKRFAIVRLPQKHREVKRDEEIIILDSNAKRFHNLVSLLLKNEVCFSVVRKAKKSCKNKYLGVEVKVKNLTPTGKSCIISFLCC
jgi:hypothetical protein